MAEKISLYNLADLKNTSDDAIPNYLNSLKFKQSHRLQDIRLALGYGAFTIAALCFLWDYQLGWDSTKHFTAAAVVLYTIINGALTFWMSMVEKDIVYEGTAPSGEKLTIASSTKKCDPTYNLTVTVSPKSGKPTKIEVSKPFAGWFDEVGYFVAAPFQELLASSVPAIGKRDPKRVKASQEMLNADPELLEAVLAAEATGSSTSDQKGARQRKA
ncbi:hypothetical protein K4F52_001852 [Lecanicillium sp. MT-2017a]|nr:hypothetical protein K4F52_001852 [Lecanicillium sp. MT-2017a]